MVEAAQPVAVAPTGGAAPAQAAALVMPAPVFVTNVVPLENPTWFGNGVNFEITFECTAALPDDLEWSLVYVGSADDSSYDQLLTEVEVGPVPVGVNKFVLSGDPPNPAAIPPADLLGVTVVLIACAYRGQEFLRIGYYVNNEAPADCEPTAQSVVRTVLAENPRVTRIDIDWLAPRADDDPAAAR